MHILPLRVLLLEDNKTRIQKDKIVKGNTDEKKKTKTLKGQEDVDTKTSKIQRKTKTQKETSLFVLPPVCLSLLVLIGASIRAMSHLSRYFKFEGNENCKK